MEIITIGSPAVTRDVSASYDSCHLDTLRPASGTGKINTLNFYVNFSVTNLLIGMFYQTSTIPLQYTARSFASLGNFSSGFNSVSSLSLNVQIGDCIGFFCETGSIYEDGYGYPYLNPIGTIYQGSWDFTTVNPFTVTNEPYGNSLSINGSVTLKAMLSQSSNNAAKLKVMGVL